MQIVDNLGALDPLQQPAEAATGANLRQAHGLVELEGAEAQ